MIFLVDTNERNGCRGGVLKSFWYKLCIFCVNFDARWANFLFLRHGFSRKVVNFARKRLLDYAFGVL